MTFLESKNIYSFVKTLKTINLIKLSKDTLHAIKGTDQDYTSISLRKAIYLLSIPMILEMVMESIFAIADIFFVSKLGSGPVAIVGITESMLTIIYAISIGLGMGTTAMVSRRIGEKKPGEASKVAFQAIVVGLGSSFLIAVPGIIFAPDLLHIMGVDAETIQSGYIYTTIMLGGNGVIMLLFIINAIFRSAGNAAISMRILWIANIINLILDPCLIFGLGPFPELGIKGAAIATNIGRGIAVLYQFYILFKGNSRIKLGLKYISIIPKIMFQLIKVSLGGIGQFIIATSSWIVLVKIIAIFGSDVLAGYTIAIRIVMFTLLPSWGLSNAAATLVGQNLGAKRPDRAEKSVWITGITNMIIMGIFAVILIINAEFLIQLFMNKEAVLNSGATCLRIISYGYLFYALGMVLMQAFNGAGDTATPTKINFFCFWLIEIPIAYLLAVFMGFNEEGVFISILAAESLVTITSFIIFRKGKWKTKQV